MTEKRSSRHCLSDLSLRSSACARPPQRRLSGGDVLSFEPYSTWEGKVKNYSRLHGTLPAIVSVWRTLEEGTVPPLRKDFVFWSHAHLLFPSFSFDRALKWGGNQPWRRGWVERERRFSEERQAAVLLARQEYWLEGVTHLTLLKEIRSFDQTFFCSMIVYLSAC